MPPNSARTWIGDGIRVRSTHSASPSLASATSPSRTGSDAGGNAELRRMYKEDIDGQIRDLGLEVPPEDGGRKIF